LNEIRRRDGSQQQLPVISQKKKKQRGSGKRKNKWSLFGEERKKRDQLGCRSRRGRRRFSGAENPAEGKKHANQRMGEADIPYIVGGWDLRKSRRGPMSQIKKASGVCKQKERILPEKGGGGSIHRGGKMESKHGGRRGVVENRAAVFGTSYDVKKGKLTCAGGGGLCLFGTREGKELRILLKRKVAL